MVYQLHIMNQTQKMDILAGIKAELSLRDAVRLALDESDTSLELIPVGKKDWIAGQRIENSIRQGRLEEVCRGVHKKLMALNADQRIRFESIKLYVVPKPVPVFKDPEPDYKQVQDTPETAVSDNAEDTLLTDDGQNDEQKQSVKQGPSVCPVCRRKVHSYNLQYNSNGRVTGCFMCGGVPDTF